ncbi:MAG TPA: isopentenyl-diphosphate Delta-isomerase [Gammaproteobacteria bacterium]|jgi:isopentenyl-diphosphate delta-isomerase type 1|nr:isopentenyl-diphosphate Delta-isomerase [Gammaproteobacteria bacterium]
MTSSESEHVILVNEQDQPIGRAEKLHAHQQGLLHRAFSIFIFRTISSTQQQEILLQQRALTKYHSAGLWTNTCCSHPREEESVQTAAERRLQEEFGFTTALQHLGWFHYYAQFSNGLAENEIDHVLVGQVPADIFFSVNANEIHAYRWITLENVQQELQAHPERFTPWFAQALSFVETKMLL